MVFGHDSERRRAILKEVAGIVSQNPFPGYFTRLEEVGWGCIEEKGLIHYRSLLVVEFGPLMMQFHSLGLMNIQN